ncbi:MAG: lysylphosphatidylglycerol synthase transmembrane domain-containing protein [Deinococcales bacterium]
MVLRSLVVSMVLSALGLAWVVFRVGRVQDLSIIRDLPWSYGLAALGGLLGAFTMAALRLIYMCRRLGFRLPLFHALRAHILGMFSATVTPGGSGSTPALALALQGQRLPPGVAWAVGVAVFGADALFHTWGLPIALGLLYALGLYPHTPGWLALGALTVVLSAAVAYLVQFRLPWLEPLARWILRGPLIRWRRRGLRFVETTLESNRLFRNAPLGFHLTLQGVTALSWISFFSILFFLARGLGVVVSLPAIEAAQMVVVVMSTFVPTPGGSGFFELGISYVLIARGGGSAVPGVVLLWRLVTFYSIFLLGPLLGGYLVTRRVQEPDGGTGTPPPNAGA